MLRLVIEAVAITPLDVPRRSTSIRVKWTSGAVDELVIPRLYKGVSDAQGTIAAMAGALDGHNTNTGNAFGMLHVVRGPDLK